MQQAKINSNIRYFGKLWRLTLSVPLLSLLFFAQTFSSLLLSLVPSLVPSLVSPVLHAEMISISELMRVSWTKISLSLYPKPPSPPSQVPAQIHTGDCILCQFQHYILSAGTHTISDMYTTKTNIRLVLENTGNVSHVWNGKSVLHIACVHVLNHLCLISRQCLKQIKILKSLHVICACLVDECLHLDVKAWEKDFVSCNVFFFYYRVFIISRFLIVGILMYMETQIAKTI